MQMIDLQIVSTIFGAIALLGGFLVWQTRKERLLLSRPVSEDWKDDPVVFSGVNGWDLYRTKTPSFFWKDHHLIDSVGRTIFELRFFLGRAEVEESLMLTDFLWLLNGSFKEEFLISTKTS